MMMMMIDLAVKAQQNKKKLYTKSLCSVTKISRNGHPLTLTPVSHLHKSLRLAVQKYDKLQEKPFILWLISFSCILSISDYKVFCKYFTYFSRFCTWPLKFGIKVISGFGTHIKLHVFTFSTHICTQYMCVCVCVWVPRHIFIYRMYV
jgi:hypothetical protein